MSFGEMKRSMKVTGMIPTIDFPVNDAGQTLQLNISAIQSSVWQKSDSVVVILANARIQSPAGVAGGQINFSFDFDGTQYGLSGDLNIQRLTPTNDGAISSISSSFTRSLNSRLDFHLISIGMMLR